jgi:hypothetical protein
VARASWRVLAALALVSAAATGALVWDGTRYPGPGLYGDGAGYLGAAESFAEHGTLRVPFANYDSVDSTSVLSQWPPAFSIVLSVPLRAGTDPLTAIRLVQALAGACTIGLTVVLVGALTAPAWGAVAAVVLLATDSITGVHLNAVSEPLYILCLAIALWGMVRHPDRPLTYGLAAAASALVRYLGTAAILGGGVWAMLQPGSSRLRVQRAVVAVLPGLAVATAWRTYFRWAGGIARPLHADHQVGAALRQLLGATAAWLAPWDLGGNGSGRMAHGAQAGFKLVFGAAIVALLAREMRAARRGETRNGGAGGEVAGTPDARLVAACVLLTACHLAALMAARLLYSDVAFYDRVLAPVHYLMAVGVIALVASRWQAVSPPLRAGLAALAVVWLLGAATATTRLVRTATTVGLDHANTSERQGATISWLRANGAGVPIYTNEPAKIFYHLGRDSRGLPWILDADTVRALERALRARPGMVVWFTGGTAASYVAPDLLARASTPAKLEGGLPLRVVSRGGDGIVWELAPRVGP